MDNKVMKFSPAIFIIILICFFLPFINITCQGEKVATLTGIQLVTGTTIEQPSMFGAKGKTTKVEGELMALLAFISAIVGLILSFLKNRKISLATAIVGGLGLIFLLLLKNKLDNDMLREGQGMLQLEYSTGFWLTLIFFILAAVWNVFIFSKGNKIQIEETKNQTKVSI
jgi:hypothetical protein